MSYSLAFSQAIITMLFISSKVERGIYDFVPTKEIAETLNIAKPSAVKILHNLQRAGLIETREGSKGGVRLAKQPADITVLDIFLAMEQERTLFNLNLQIKAKGERPNRAQQAIAQVLTTAEEAMKNQLLATSLAHLLNEIR